MLRVLPRHVEKQWGIGGVYPQFEKNLKKVRLTSPNSSLSYNENQFVGISGFDEISGLTISPPYPAGFFKNPSMVPYGYQNGGDWCWFGGRMIQQ
jgi:hypothetical protein